MAHIDATARIADGARIGEDVEIGPYCVVGPAVELKDGVRLLSHVCVNGVTTIGERTVVYPFASLGAPPQSVRYRGGPTQLVIGANCDIREGVTISTGTEDGRGVTEIGDRCFLMANSHVGHDCKIGSDVTLANNAMVAGHVSIGDYAVLAGGTALLQFTRVGTGAMITGLSAIGGDVIPWGIVQGVPALLVGLNVIGMRRKGISKADIGRYHRAYTELFFGAGQYRDRLEALAQSSGDSVLIAEMIAFIRAGERPLTMARARGEGAESNE